MRGAAALFLVLAVSGTCHGVDKRWKRTWDTDSLDNWEGRKSPCEGKAAILPRHPSHPIFLSDDISLGSLELPIDGELILGQETHMVFDDKAKSHCQDAKWSHTGYDEWWDPDGWWYPGYGNPTSSPVPHVHRVPCTRDTAIFVDPNQSLYSVHLTAPTIRVAKLTIGDKNYTTSQLATYAQTTEGSFRFVGASSSIDGAQLYVEDPEPCTDVTGCFCTNQDAEAKICGIKSSKCPSAPCDSAQTMEGFCCPVCGAEVIISHNGSLPLQSILTLLQKHMKTVVANNVQGYAAKMGDGQYHVYFTSSSETGDYKAASQSFKAKFEKELNSRGVHAAIVSFSGSIIPQADSTSNNLLSIFITLTIIFAVAAAVYYFKQRRATSQLSFMFRRLESSSRRVSVASHMGDRRASTSSSIFTYTRDGGLRFQNPIFNQSMASLAEANATSVINESALGEQLDGERENPVYNAYEQMSPEERQANEETLQARERILEAAGDLAAVLESSVQNMDAKPETSRTDLEVIAEEKEARIVVNEEEPDKDNIEETSDIDPLGITIASFPDKDSLDSLDTSLPEKSTETVNDTVSQVDEFQMVLVDEPGASLVNIDGLATEETSQGLITEGKQDSPKSDETSDVTDAAKDDNDESSLEKGEKDEEDTMDIQGFEPFGDFSFDS
ncbi:uncharacterized protein LOC134765440 [Penaeus indicus]|uniref:uncharacterized protein LOC134765440 n=1 Tax=Penaeus indicus TaxID=29960 RepID=UPI00300D24FB